MEFDRHISHVGRWPDNKLRMVTMDDQTSHYTVLARRFRPQTFGDVVGQEHIAHALRNAIHKSKVAHAYIFTGSRGVGKTSMARILAKSLNCPAAVDANPCNDCEICDGISAGNDIDVLEIDGASNRGIDDIRTLRANVNVKSMRSKYKIYIIDEVHMLTKEAFNALLKTLEEPPPKVKFIFCTTEPNKVPDTILSRCQRFDFGTIATDSIAKRLATIAETEGANVDRDAVELIARRAAGSMRDSQSLFDQLLSFGGDQISVSDVHRLFGTAPDERLIELAGHLLQRRRDSALQLFNQALADGVQLGELTDQLVSYFRDLMVLASDADEVAMLSVSNSCRAELKEQAKTWGLQTIVAALQILAETKGRMQKATYGRALAELALIRISLLENLEEIDGLIAQLKSGTFSQPSPSPASSGSSTRAPKPQSAKAVQSAPAASIPEQSENRQKSQATPTPESPQKKTEIIEPDVVNSTETTEKPCSEVALVDGCEQELWSQILAKIDDMLRNHVRPIENVAISGPNRLDLTFPKSYHFNKQYCERSEVLGQLERVASEITGQPIRISLFVSDADDSSAKDETSKSGSDRRIDIQDDELVQQAIAVFGATVEKVVPIVKQSRGKD